MNLKTQILIGASVVVVFGLLAMLTGMLGINNGQNWVYLQYPTGTVRIVDEPGIYVKAFGRNWVYPRYYDFRYNADPDDGDKINETIEVTYNDGGTAFVSTYIRLRSPINREDRISFHQQTAGSRDNVKAATKSFMIDCLKSTAPLMSSSENQSARKAEFKQTVEGQLTRGAYKMTREKITAKDITDTTGKAITIYKTEVVIDKDGNPIIVQQSPIVAKFKMTVEQFSVTGTDYDPETRKQFALKKAAFLLTEQAKADREKEVQTRLMIIEKGLKDKAEATAKANVIKEKAVIEAQQKAEVALQTKIAAETRADQLLSVAEIAKKEKLMIASMKLEVAKIGAQEAEAKKRAMILQAQGRKEAIELSGAITEIEQAMIDASVEKARVVAEALARIKVPSTMFIGGSGNGENGSNVLTTHLINLKLMEATGILDKIKINKTAVDRKINRN